MTEFSTICWDPLEVPEIINPYAEHISDGIFRFVHSDWDLSIARPRGTNYQDLRTTDYTSKTQVEFLEDFLDENKPHVLAAILGTTGSGKSHLVHWMRFNLPSNAHRLVIVVKKSGTSLKQIVLSIIDQLPEDEKKPFMDTFRSAGDGSISFNNQKHKILDDLSVAIRETNETLDGSIDEVSAVLTEFLPHMLQDPYMRSEHFTKDGTVIADLAHHIFSTSKSDHRPDDRRQFSVKDLPLGGKDFRAASNLAKEAIDFILMDVEHQQKAVNILNNHLDSAIARSLNFSGDVIEQLMVSLRRHLKQEDKELVLLVEEFARLQGIDRVLLQTITTQGGGDQCKMRTAIAVTTGFFESVAETAYMRTTDIVNMDLVASTGTSDKTISKRSLSKFVSKYLNAARSGMSVITDWAAKNDFKEMPVSKCDACAKKEKCHAAFGEIDGIGLFPFTETAIWNLTQRTDDNFPNSFNPRIIQNNLLKPVLDNCSTEIRNFKYPSMNLLNQFGGPKSLPSVKRTELTNLDPHKADRWIPFLEIFDGSGQLVNPETILLEELGLDAIPNADSIVAGPITPIQPVDPNPKKVKEDPLQQYLDAWEQGEPLDQRAVQRLREFVFAALNDSIRWDELNLIKSYISASSGSKPFRRQSINFEKQAVNPQNSKINLFIHCNQENATALKGLAKFNEYKHSWNFDDGLIYFYSVNKAIRSWQAELEQQIVGLNKPTKNWNASAASLELLLIGSAMNGSIKHDMSNVEMLDAIFKDWHADAKYLSENLTKLYFKIYQNKQALVDEFLAFSISSKGGVTGHMLNPEKFFMNMKKFTRGTWNFQQDEPNLDTKIGKLYLDVSVGLTEAIEEERQARVAWLVEVENNFGEMNRSEIVETINSFIQAIEISGHGSGQHRQALKVALDDYSVRYYDDAVRLTKILKSEEATLGLLARFGGTRSAAVNSTNELIRCLDTSVTSTEQILGSKSDIQDRDLEEFAILKSTIDEKLTEIESLVSDVSGVGENE